MKSEWRVSYNPMAGYIAYRLRNTEVIDHSGNREYYGEYSENQQEIQEIVDKLNSGEIGV